ncbi:MAG TPA: sporulation initiation factor Spo0A C-terminal domain-containing protein [Candidatus Enterenecus merdae]|nr:sporulation initiation factor Spo0A C-terminal domain-containing protein [Candidatus Enterenecus merdae]
MEIYDLLYRLGVTANYTGFFHMAYAVQLCARQPERLQLVTKWLYPDVARRYQTNWRAVERNIRTVSRIAWAQGRPLLEQLAGRALPSKPCAAQLLAILAYSLLAQPSRVPVAEGQAAAPASLTSWELRGARPSDLPSGWDQPSPSTS